MTDRFPVLHGAEPWSSPGSGARADVGVVVSHGFTGNPHSTRPLGEALARAGFAVTLPRLPGHGTHFRDMMRTRYSDWRAEIERAVDELRRAGKTHVFVVGLSLGGTIAIDLACTRADAVSGAVPINATILDREGLVAKLAPFLEKVLPVVPAAAAGLVKNDIAKGGDERAYAYVPARAGNSLLRELPRIREALAHAHVPFLVAYSPQDHSVPADNSRALLKLLEGKDATELVLPRSYHVATLDHDLELLVEGITAFCDRVSHAR